MFSRETEHFLPGYSSCYGPMPVAVEPPWGSWHRYLIFSSPGFLWFALPLYFGSAVGVCD